jgi:hypothetical protein
MRSAALRPVLRPGRRSGSILLALLVLVAALAAAPAARAGDDSLAAEGGLGVGSAVCTLVYAPLKLAYAVGGVVLSGLAFLWTWDPQVSGDIYYTSVAGDYVVTPEHLRGRDDLVFAGDS